MRRILIGLVIFCAFALQAEAQNATSQYAGKVKYQKTEQDATIFEFPYPVKQVEDGLKDLAAKQGVKVKQKNGFYEARNMLMNNLDHKNHDVYYRVDKMGKSGSKVYMILADPGEDLANRTSSHVDLAGAVAGGAVILASVAPHLDEHDFNVAKIQQENDIKKAEKKLSGLQDDQRKLEKRLADLNKEIEKNATNQKNAAAELEAKKSGLLEFLGNRGLGKKKN